MQIWPEKLKDGIPVSVEESYNPQALELELVDLKFLENLSFKGSVVKESNSIRLEGKLKSRVKRICGRTLKEVEEPLELKFQQFYAIENREVIDATDDIREAVLLEQPMVYYAPGSEGEARALPEQKSSQGSDEDSPFAKLKKLRNLKKE